MEKRGRACLEQGGGLVSLSYPVHPLTLSNAFVTSQARNRGNITSLYTGVQKMLFSPLDASNKLLVQFQNGGLVSPLSSLPRRVCRLLSSTFSSRSRALPRRRCGRH